MLVDFEIVLDFSTIKVDCEVFCIFAFRILLSTLKPKVIQIDSLVIKWINQDFEITLHCFSADTFILETIARIRNDCRKMITHMMVFCRCKYARGCTTGVSHCRH
uniref:Uncharacterized protein n=1 Tax=Oxyrrhis marina TaxID=2969 RepID=A0A7S3XGC4_OXYMA